MSDLSVYLEQVQSLRTEMLAQHGRQSERMEKLTSDMNGGLNGIRAEMQLQNGRVAKNEGDVRVLEERVQPVQRAVYALIGLVCVAVVLAVLNLVVTK